jgi:ubiquinone/menaquinone biosynthesis C-methylase UbiE
MRADWNLRALEDAYYYAAFGRRSQGDDEFLATAAPIVLGLERELKWISQGVDRQTLRALEIGCGPGRLMLPMSRHFGEIHGVDVSDEMIRLARDRLRDIPHARVHHTSGAELAGFDDNSFDFVYSYAVFQHIPSREVVFNYLRETVRVLRVGGLVRCQLNGLPEAAARYDTWNGVRISAPEVTDFARANALQLLALEGVSTQYMWITARKVARRLAPQSTGAARIRRITNCHTSEPVVPSRGRFASASLWVEDLPAECSLLDLEANIGPTKRSPFYIGPPDIGGLQQVNVALPESVETGLLPVQLWWLREPLSGEATCRVIPPGPPVPRVISVSDAVDLMSGMRIRSRAIKVTLEEANQPQEFCAYIDGQQVENIDVFCVDPLAPRHEVNLQVPDVVGTGSRQLEMRLGRRRFPPVSISVE